MCTIRKTLTPMVNMIALHSQVRDQSLQSEVHDQSLPSIFARLARVHVQPCTLGRQCRIRHSNSPREPIAFQQWFDPPPHANLPTTSLLWRTPNVLHLIFRIIGVLPREELSLSFQKHLSDVRGHTFIFWRTNLGFHRHLFSSNHTSNITTPTTTHNSGVSLRLPPIHSCYGNCKFIKYNTIHEYKLNTKWSLVY